MLVRVALSRKKSGQYADYPKLDAMLARNKPRAPQTPEQMLGIVKMLNAAFGGIDITQERKA